MKTSRAVLALALAIGLGLGVPVMAGAQTPVSGGTVTITKACGPGVSGTATFDLTLTFEGQSASVPDLPLNCGESQSLPGLPVGTEGVLHETAPPTGGVAAPDLHFTVTTADQSLTIVNNPPVSGGLGIHKVCPSGFTGTAGFTVTFTLANDASGGTSSVSVPCGQTKPVAIPASANFTNTSFSAHETSAPLGTNGAPDQTGTLSGSAQVLTFSDTVAAAPAGPLKIHKTCASGVTGVASFSVMVTPVGGTGQAVTVSIECGATATVAIPSAVDLVGAAVIVHETTPPTKGAPSADVTATLSADTQTLTIVNALQATGALKIHKTCASGVTGTAVFAVTVTVPGATSAMITLNVPCGQTVAVVIPAAQNLIDSQVKIHEQTPPTGGVAAADVTATLTGADQTLTINNTQAVSVVPPPVPVLAQTGEPRRPPSLQVLLFVLGALLTSGGLRLIRRSTG